ncbi:hypothetical protein ACEWPM_005485 [Roseovarius sp. S4756]|uniref:hypothetical protein n=1 Tax=Roseovarius maritimus TaxID=3342637 RepID=UPI0037288424
MDGIILAIILGSMAYMVWSARRFFKGFRVFLEANIAGGTVTSRLLPNLSFAALFFLLLNQTALVDGFEYAGIEKGNGLFGSIVNLTRIDDPMFGIADLDSAPGNRTAAKRNVMIPAFVTGGDF